MRDHSASTTGRKQIRILKCATNPTRQNSKTQKLKNSKTQKLRNSGTQELRNTGTQKLT
jgi:hypothetical protein